MAHSQISGSDQSRIESYYFQTEQFARPIHFRLLSGYHSELRARIALEGALKGVKVIGPVQPANGMQFMNLPGVFDERGAQIRETE